MATPPNKIIHFIEKSLLVFPVIIFGLTPSLAQTKTPVPDATKHWPMAAGPFGNGTTLTEAKPPVSWSVSNRKNILWRTPLPEAGLSGIAVWGDRLFLTTNKPLPAGTTRKATKGSDIIGYCLSASSGKVLWQVDIPSTNIRPYSGLFSDNSSATPVTDGKHVWFINTGGMIACFDMQGQKIWSRPFHARTRHNAKQCQPILIGNQLLYVMMREKDDPLAKPMKAQPGNRKSPPELWPWTYLRSFDAASGKPLWLENSGTSVHNTPKMGYLDGKPFVFHARGGGHKPPESPYGFSMSYVGGRDAGKILWSHDAKNPFVYTVSQFDSQHAYGIDQGSLLKLDARSGKLLKNFPLFQKAHIRMWDRKEKKYVSQSDAPFSMVTKKFKPIPTNHTPILLGKYFLFLTHEGHCIGRVNTETGKVEYLQVPVQIVRKPDTKDQFMWDNHIPAMAKNSRGIITAEDKRAQGDGWGHVTAASPIAVNQYVFFSTMIGMTYVVDTSRKIFDESAIVSINDLGPAGATWSLSSPSYSKGKIFHRSLKEIVCIGIAEN